MFWTTSTPWESEGEEEHHLRGAGTEVGRGGETPEEGTKRLAAGKRKVFFLMFFLLLLF